MALGFDASLSSEKGRSFQFRCFHPCCAPEHTLQATCHLHLHLGWPRQRLLTAARSPTGLYSEPRRGPKCCRSEDPLALRYPGVDTPQSELRQFRGAKSAPPPRGGSGGPVCVSPRLVRTTRGLAAAGNARASPGAKGVPAAREKARAPPRRLTQEGGRNPRRQLGVQGREGGESWCNAAQCDRTALPGGGWLRPELGGNTSASLGPDVGKA